MSHTIAQFVNLNNNSAVQNKQAKPPLPQAGAAKAADRPPRAKEDRHFVTALARGLEVLSAFRSRDRMLGNQELASRSGLPKSTISRLTHTLTREGYLEPASDGKGASGYRLGSAVLALGGRCWRAWMCAHLRGR